MKGSYLKSTMVAGLAALGLAGGMAFTPVAAHCAGKHTGSHPHCSGGGGGGGGGGGSEPATYNISLSGTELIGAVTGMTDVIESSNDKTIGGTAALVLTDQAYVVSGGTSINLLTCDVNEDVSIVTSGGGRWFIADQGGSGFTDVIVRYDIDHDGDPGTAMVEATLDLRTDSSAGFPLGVEDTYQAPVVLAQINASWGKGKKNRCRDERDLFETTLTVTRTDGM